MKGTTSKSALDSGEAKKTGSQKRIKDLLAASRNHNDVFWDFWDLSTKSHYLGNRV